MPFDGTRYQNRNPALEKIDKVIDLLSDPRRWCKRQLRSQDGRYCMLGAMQAADAEKELSEPIMLAINQITGRGQWIDRFNDDVRTTHADVIKVLRQARQNIIGGTGFMTREKIGGWALFGRHSQGSAS